MEALPHEELTEKESQFIAGRTVKKKFFAALLAGFLLLGGMAAAFGISGVAYAVPMAGVGDFHVKFDKLTGSGFKLFAKVGDNGNDNAVPQFRVKIDNATIHGLHIYKVLDLPGVGKIQFNITASKPVQVKGLIQDGRTQTGNATFTNQTIDESPSGDHHFSQTADSLTLTNGNILTDYLFQSAVTLNGLHLSFSRP